LRAAPESDTLAGLMHVDLIALVDDGANVKRERRAFRRTLAASEASKDAIIAHAAVLEAERDAALELLTVALDVLAWLTDRTRLEVADALRRARL
jgi:NADH:ubiquinone oxidoreductase subunit E